MDNDSSRPSIALLCVAGFAGFFGAYLRIPVLPLLAASLGGGPDQVGLVNASFMFAAGFLSIPAGLLADRIGLRKRHWPDSFPSPPLRF